MDKTNAGARLWRIARTTILLVAAGLSSVLMVNLPTTLVSQTNNQASAAPPIVKASDKWITLGTEPSDGQGLASTRVIAHVAVERMERQQARPRRKPKRAQLAGRSRPSASAQLLHGGRRSTGNPA